MLVFDENVHQRTLMDSVAAWYRGRVVSVATLRPGTVIKDEAIPVLLQQVKGATFITTNVSDFWQRAPAHAKYGIVCLVLSNERLHELPALLRQLFSLSEFKIKPLRMGKIVRVSSSQIQYYQISDDRVHTLVLPN